MPDEILWQVNEAARAAGKAPSTIRDWANRDGLRVAARTAFGHFGNFIPSLTK